MITEEKIVIIEDSDSNRYGYYISFKLNNRNRSLVSSKDYDTKEAAKKAAQRALKTFK